MDNKLFFTNNEKSQVLETIKELRNSQNYVLTKSDELKVFQSLKQAIIQKRIQRDIFGLNPILSSIQTALIAIEEIGLKRDGVVAVLLYSCFTEET